MNVENLQGLSHEEAALRLQREGLNQLPKANSRNLLRIFLDVLREIVDSGLTPAERKLALFHGAWGGSVDPVFREFAY